ncbi:MAG: hypothetical protein KGH75_07650 [Rhodospirillales bacterium]|nr:hypothetical protein [Rhodospirillales bacterium]
MMHGGTKARESKDAWDTHQLFAVSLASLKRGCSTMGINVISFYMFRKAFPDA